MGSIVHISNICICYLEIYRRIMIEDIKFYLQEKELSTIVLYWCLIAILFLLVLLAPTFERGPDMAIFLASLALVIVAVIGYRFSSERNDLLEEQNNKIESQSSKLDAVNKEFSKQTEMLQELSIEVDKIIEETETDDDNGEHKEAEESTEG